LVTHAFFKACLFLGAGSVIHAVSGEQDMRRMGGLREKVPQTFRTMQWATYAIAGLPLGAGFFSKDEILASAWSTPYFPGVAEATGCDANPRRNRDYNRRDLHPAGNRRLVAGEIALSSAPARGRRVDGTRGAGPRDDAGAQVLRRRVL